MSTFASGAKAKGICDQCGLTFKLSTLKALVVSGKTTTTRVCKACYVPDHPQLHVGRRPVHDPQALRDPRPDNALAESRNIAWGWPVVYSLASTAVIGKVTT